eukprot:4379091-Amphidinium_carterae.1
MSWCLASEAAYDAMLAVEPVGCLVVAVSHAQLHTGHDLQLQAREDDTPGPFRDTCHTQKDNYGIVASTIHVPGTYKAVPKQPMFPRPVHLMHITMLFGSSSNRINKSA